MTTIEERPLKSFGSQEHQVTGKGKRKRVWWWQDPAIKKVFADFCRAEGLKICEAIEEALLLFIQNYKTRRVHLDLQVTLNKSISYKDKSELKTGIIKELNPLRLKQVAMSSFNQTYVCPNEHKQKMVYQQLADGKAPNCRVCGARTIPNLKFEMSKIPQAKKRRPRTKIPEIPPDPAQTNLEGL